MTLTINIVKKFKDFTLDIDFSSQKEVTVLFGPSGSGKTTLLRCIAGLLKPDFGIIKLNGQTFYSTEQSIYIPPQKRHVGYVFQNYALFPHLTVEQNILYGANRKTRDITLKYEILLSLLKIAPLAERYPRNLSGGEAQRVALARALLTEPSILLLDEPLSALDEHIRRELQLELKKLHSLWNIPFIFVTHDRSEAEIIADKIVNLDKGRISDIIHCN